MFRLLRDSSRPGESSLTRESRNESEKTTLCVVHCESRTGHPLDLGKKLDSFDNRTRRAGRTRTWSVGEEGKDVFTEPRGP